MSPGGVRLRGTAAVYVLLEDAAIVALLVGAFAFAHFGQLDALASPAALVLLLGLLLLIKGSFFICGLYDFRLLAPRAEFWTKLCCGAVLSALLVWALERSVTR